jgi:hypothetical protein
VLAQGIGITDNALYTKTSNNVAIILFFRLFTAKIDLICVKIICTQILSIKYQNKKYKK